MDLIKIGKFIAGCRKEKKITQSALAEKLMITDRAVSKWERGLSLPDADKMLDLCEILDINVNELLNGEKIDMKNYEKKTENETVRVPVVGLPGCVMYAKKTIFDLVLPRLLADDPVRKEELDLLGEGGLL